MTNTSAKFLEELERIDPQVRGSLTLYRDDKGYLSARGEVFPSPAAPITDPQDLVKAALESAFPDETIPAFPLKSQFTSARISVVSHEDNTVAGSDQYKNRETLYTRDPSDPPRRDRHVNIVHLGYVSVDRITDNANYKKENWQTRDKVGNCIVELGFFAPVVLDQNFQIIDGQQRVSLARELGVAQIIAVVLDVDGVKADFLRLALNRSSEFQKWKHDELDPYVNAHPELQPLLEPLGFFGERILPVSFFGDTIVSYKLDEYHYQQSAYKQELGLAQWAKIQRERVEAMEAERQAKRKKPEVKPLTDGLFG